MTESMRAQTTESFFRLITVDNFHGRHYQDEVLALREGGYIDFPATVTIETLSLCNAACNFCPYPGLDRKGERLQDEIIEKIFNDISEIPDRPPFKFSLSRVNEPFLDTRIFTISQEVERRFPEASAFFFSNGSPLTEKNLLSLAELKRVDFLNISINDHRRHEYERIMGLPYDSILQRLHLICEMRNSGLLKFPILLSRVGDGTRADRDFLGWVQDTYPSLSGVVRVRGNWLGAVQGQVAAAPDVGCRQWFEVHVLTNGRAAHCCIDPDGSHGTGDASHQHLIREIYNHPVRRHLRKEVSSRGNVDICATCPMLP